MWLDVLHEKHYKALYGFTREAEAYDWQRQYQTIKVSKCQSKETMGR